MASPFPGMDPYLESAELSNGVRLHLLCVVGELLTPQLRRGFFVDLRRREYVLEGDDPARDIHVPRFIRGPINVSEPFLVVLSVPDRTVVTVVEVLSPTNKTPGSHGRDEYLAKRRQVLHSPVHLVEVDLLRVGARIPTVDALPRCDYMVHVSRASVRPRGEIFPWGLRDRLPVIPLPVRKGDADARLDLAAALTLVYERNSYDLAVDYTRPPPEPALPADDAAWAAELAQRASRNG